MTPEAQRIAIAEVSGWKLVERDLDTNYGSVKAQVWFNPNGIRSNQNTGSIEALPDYRSDLNAMHEAEEVLTEKQHDDYCWRLRIIKANGEIRGTKDFEIVHATAAQRADAFVGTLGK